MTAPPSAHELEKQLTALAYSAAGRQPPAKTQAPDVPLVPIYVGIDTEPQQQLRETFLYRLGDDKWGVKPATSRLLLETGLPGGHTEKNVHDMITAGLRPYTNSSVGPLKGAGQMQLVRLQLYARKGDQVFRDEVVWDVGNPVNSAQPYAVRVCAALRLGADWFDVIRSHLQQQLDDVRQDLLQAPHEVQLQQPVKRARRTVAGAADSGSGTDSGRHVGVPRIELYDPAHDVEAERVAARQQKLQRRQQAAGVQQQQPQQQPPGQPPQGLQQQQQQQQPGQQQQLPGQHQVGQMPPQQQVQQLPPQLQAAEQQQQHLQQQQHMQQQQQQQQHRGQQPARLHHVPPGQVQPHMMQQQQQPQQHVQQQPPQR